MVPLVVPRAGLIAASRQHDPLLLQIQLTAALHIDEGDYEAALKFLPMLERKVERILVTGFGTGVKAGHAMVRGGPYAATSDGRT